MTYRIHSNKYNHNYWYIAIPKTGSQSVRKYIEDNIPQSLLVEHSTKKWHLNIEDITKSSDFNYTRDGFFSTVRNPWAQAWSNYNYQKKQLEAKLRAYNRGPAGIEEYRASYPLNIISDYDNDSWPETIKFYNSVLSTFEEYVSEIKSYHNCPTLNSINDLLEFNKSKYRLPAVRATSFRVSGMVQSQIFNYSDSYTNSLLVMPIEKPEIIIRFFRDYFPEAKSNSMPFVNKGDYNNDYRKVYSSEMIKTISQVEQPLISRFGYKFGE